MIEKEMIKIANCAITKRMNYEELKYSDYLYGKENLIDDVWKYVEECDMIGIIAYNKKYNDY